MRTITIVRLPFRNYNYDLRGILSLLHTLN
jgi:hypothetical protein